MYKSVIKNLLFALLCFLIGGTAAWADDTGGTTTTSVAPSITSDDEVCVFFASPSKDATYTLYLSGDKYTGGTADPGDQLQLLGTQFDGSYLYKWERPTGATGLPTTVTLYKDGKKIYENQSFVNHGLYRETISKTVKSSTMSTEDNSSTKTIDYVKTGVNDQTLASLDSTSERSVFFETNVHNAIIYAWVWGGGQGGEYYTSAGSWPGDPLTELGEVSPGRYLYKWTQTVNYNPSDTKNPPLVPQQVIFSPKPGLNSDQFNCPFVNHGYYVNNVEYNDDQQTLVQQYGRVYVGEKKSDTDLDPLAVIQNDNEKSLFIESPKELSNEAYYAWPWTEADRPDQTATNVKDGQYYTGTTWPGTAFEPVGRLENGSYLYKWTQTATTDQARNLVLARKEGTKNAETVLDGATFINHAYYKLDNNGKISFVNTVTRYSDGRYTASRTTYGKRVIYEMNVGSFAGNFQGATAQLNNLKKLGVDVIWLMPIFQRGKGNSPYATKDYYAINPAYGSETDFQNFVKSAHDLGMDVWLDIAIDHTAMDNKWADPNSTDFHPEYYVGYNKDAKTDTTGFDHPFHMVDGKKVYYGFNDVYQLDFTHQEDEKDAQGNVTGTFNPADRAIREVLEHWLQVADIDGYRFDFVSGPIPNYVWQHLTSDLKTKKPTIQFLAEANLAGGDGERIDRSNFQYDYAWTLNDDLFKFGANTGGKRLSQIVNSYLNQTNGKNIDRMVYLTNHDVNWNNRKSLRGIFGNNRFAMTVFEFTMPGMPLIYNGQEQNGNLLLDYFNDTRIDWNATSDPNMLGLIQELSHLKHTNNAISDGNSPDLRGDTYILNAYDDHVIAYERVRGDEHVLVVLNLGGDPVASTTIEGATPGSWKQILKGGRDGITNPQSNYENITESWGIENIPANGFEIYTFTGARPDKQAGVYLVTEDSKNDDTKHLMTLNGPTKDEISINGGEAKNYDVYTYSINAADFDKLNTKDNSTTSEGNTLNFKLQEYYPFYIGGTVCKAAAPFATTTEGTFKTTDGKTYVSCAKNDAAATNSLKITKDAKAIKYIITFYRGKGDIESNAGFVTVRALHEGDAEAGWFLVTPMNDLTITGASTKEDWQKKHQWKFKTENEDPQSVNDSYIKTLNENKYSLCSYKINAEDFDKYVYNKASQAIQFRIQEVETDLNENSGEINPEGNKDLRFSEKDNICKNSYWNTKGWFIIPYQEDVSSYIIQMWKTSEGVNGETRVRVLFVKKFNYKGSTIEDIASSEEEVYLYNVDAQKFLYVGNRWGTMASLLYDDLGTRLNILPGKTDLDTRYKMISTRFEGAGIVPNGHMLGIDDFGYDKNGNAFDRLDEANIFCDRNNGDMWLIEKADSIDYANTYTLSLYNENDGRYHFMLADHSDGTDSLDLVQNTQVKYVATPSESLNVSQLIAANALNDGVQIKPSRENPNRLEYVGGNTGVIDYKYDAPYEGSYQLGVQYISGGDRPLSVSVGNGEAVQKTATSTGSYDNTNVIGHVYYTLHLKKGTNHIYIGKQADWAPNIVGVTISLERPADLKYGRWQFITYKDLVAKLKNENAELYGGTTADATFLLTDQGFTRNVEKTWDTTDDVKCDKSAIGHNPDNGMYWNAHITGQGDVYQDVSVPIYGVYRFDAYGFYHGATTNMFVEYTDATGKIQRSDINLVNETDASYDYKDNSSDLASGKMFYNESVLDKERKHLNTLYFYIPQDAQHTTDGYYKIRIGFHKNADVAGNNYTAVDDVHLHYNGKATFILDETAKNVDNFSTERRTNTPVWLKRKFAAEQWNTLVLPVPVSAQQLRQTFGSDVQVATPYGLDDNNPYLIKFSPMDLNSGAGANGLQAGKFYIIKPGKKMMGTKTVLNLKDNGNNSYTAETETATDGTMFYDLGSHDINNLPQTVDTLTIRTLDFHAASAGDTKRTHNAINFIGSYHQFPMPTNSYAFTSKGRVVKWKGKETTLNGFRFFIKDVPNEDPNQTADSKMFVMGSLSDDLEGVLNSFDYQNGGKGETTGINEINNSDNSQDVHDAVFDLSGRRVGENGNIDNLPKGVYIINGKKYIKD